MVHLLSLSGLFFVLQIASSFAFASDNFVAARIFGAASVADYSVTMRLLGIVPMIMAMIQSPLWPAYGEAIARGDKTWVRRMLIRSLLMTSTTATVLTIPLVLAGAGIMHLWVGDRVHPSLSLLFGMGLWSIQSSVGSALAMYLNGANVIRFQVISALVMASASFALKIVLAHTVGLPGIIWGTVIAYGLFTLLPCMILISRTVNQTGRSSS
jgi:O-antigen/teichoic acid export membrane protein